MFEALDRKLMNVWVLFDLMQLTKKKYPDAIKERKSQNKRIRRLMKRAYEIPFYRAKFEAANVTPKDFRCAEDLKKFPVLTKRELRAWMEEECGKEKYKYYDTDFTSGSSATPTKILYSPREKAWNTANWLRVLMKAGFNPFFGLTMCRRDHNDFTPEQNMIQRMGILRRKFVKLYIPEQEIIDCINKAQPGLLYINKQEFMRVSMYARCNNCKVFHPSLYIPVGEMIDDNSREVMESVFGPNLLDSFGTAETGACMVKFPGEAVHRIHTDLFVVDVWDENDPDVDTGLLTVTPLYKTDIPIINYVVGDIATKQIVNGETVISEVRGRSSDFIVHDDGQVTSYFMLSDTISHCIGVIQMRLVQKSYEEIEVQLVKDAGYSGTKEEIEGRLRISFGKNMKKPMRINFRWVDSIRADKNGKLRLIVSEVTK